MNIRLVAALALVAGAASARATVIDVLPTPEDNRGWRTAAFSLADYNYATDELTMETNSGGVFFGTELGGGAPAFSLGSSSAGNQLSMTARFSDGARDWSAYLNDGSTGASMVFGPTNCDGNAMPCYGAPFMEGVQLWFADAFGSGDGHALFIDLDMQIDHQFGLLMKDGLVAYRIDGHSYSGYAVANTSRILVIGDGSGSTQTGYGAMTLSSVFLDTAPEATVVLAVPEPASWATMLGGFALIGAAARRAKRVRGVVLSSASA